MSAPLNGAGNVNDFAALSALRKDARAQTPESLREAARQFESLFTKMMLDSMRKSSMGDPLFGRKLTQRSHQVGRVLTFVDTAFCED